MFCHHLMQYINFNTNISILAKLTANEKTRKKVHTIYQHNTLTTEKKVSTSFFSSQLFLCFPHQCLYSCSIQFSPISILILSIFLIQLFKNRSAITGPVTVYQHDENLEKT